MCFSCAGWVLSGWWGEGAPKGLAGAPSERYRRAPNSGHETALHFSCVPQPAAQPVLVVSEFPVSQKAFDPAPPNDEHAHGCV